MCLLASQAIAWPFAAQAGLAGACRAQGIKVVQRALYASTCRLPQEEHTEPNGFLCSGDQYESVLNSKLTDLGIEFWTEASLREQGYFKTPDALLQVDRTSDIFDGMHGPLRRGLTRCIAFIGPSNACLA